MSKSTVFAWVDLETTGLDAESGRVLEYAVILTDMEGTELDCLTAVIPQNVGIARTMMDEFCTRMHYSNGLLEELESLEINAPQYADSIEQAEEDILAMFKSVHDRVVDYEVEVVFVVAGSNVLFDVKWMMKHFPRLVEKMDHRGKIDGPESYRCLDVSNYKMGFPAFFKSSSNATHRAMDDIRFSLSQHQRMIDVFEKAWKYDQLDR